MELTWVSILASLAMGLAAACIFIFAVKKDYFRDIEDAKYQVFWSDLEELVEPHSEPRPPGSGVVEPKENANGNQQSQSR